jgi:prepilin-type N-terminal cleavage/methylation domain-containing protein
MDRPPRHDCVRPPRDAGFTLVELLIVVIILAILSAVALPSFGNQRVEAVASALKANVMQVVMVLEHQKQKTVDGTYPSTIEPAWFVAGQLPHHPDDMAGVPAVEIVAVPGLLHPRDKLVQPGVAGAYWYNTMTGAFRARVKSLGDVAETMAFYNQVNGVGAAATPSS